MNMHDENNYPSLCDLLSKYKTDKNTRHSYGPVYEDLLAPYREVAKNVLEIGVDKGASMEVWREYFVNATITGIDNNPISLPPSRVKDVSRMKFYKLHQASSASLKAFAINHYQQFDIIIDDGSHVPRHQLMTRDILWDALKPGGLMVIEDIQNTRALILLRNFRPEIVDVRAVKGRYDDVLAIFRKPVDSDMKLGSNYIR
jgi:trans-aconitate methyltransferase